VLAGNLQAYSGAKLGPANMTADNMFNGPAGLSFDAKGRLCIRRDGNASDAGDFGGMGHNKMLMGDPSMGEIHWLLWVPRGCEVTGLCWSEDDKIMFVGVQHPGVGGAGRFPPGGTNLLGQPKVIH